MSGPKFDHECRLIPTAVLENVDDHTIESCRALFPGIRTYTGAPFPPEPVVVRRDSSRDVLRQQSELIAKYAAHCESKAATCSNVATLVEYQHRAKLARDISLIYFRAATLEDSTCSN